MRLLVMADGEVGRRTVEWLAANYPQDLVAIVTVDPTIATCAEKASVHSICSGDGDEISKACLELGPIDLGLLAWWPQIVKKPLLNIPMHGFINFHPSLLPHNRGKHYNFWAIVEQAPFGVSLHFVDEGVDSGDIVAQRRIDYGWLDTGETLYRKAQQAMFELFCEEYPRWRGMHIKRAPQDLSQGSFHRASELESASALDLDSTYVCRDLLNRLRARTFQGYPACSFVDGDVTYEVRVQISKVNE